MKIYDQINQYLYWCQYIADYTEQTVSSKKHVLYKIAEQAKIKDIFSLTMPEFAEWRNGMMSGDLNGGAYKLKTINTRIKCLRVFIKWAEEFYKQTANLNTVMIQRVRAVNFEQDYTFYTQNQIKTIAENSPEFERLMILIFFESGLRISEFRNIKIKDIDFSSGSIFVIGKGRKPADVYFSFKTGLELRNYIERSGLSQEDFLWKSPASSKGLPYTNKTIRKKLKICFENCGFYNFYPHQLRHSFATNLIEHGASLYEAQKLLRHSDIRTTQIYLHNLQNKVNSAYRRIFNEEIYYLKSPLS